MSYKSYESLKPKDVLQSEMYIGSEFDYGLQHWKYIDRFKTSKGWRYIYKKTKSAGKAVQKKARDAAKTIDGALGADKKRELMGREARYRSAAGGADSVNTANSRYAANIVNRNNANKHVVNSKPGSYEYERNKKELDKASKELDRIEPAKNDYEKAKKAYDKTFYGKVDKLRKNLKRK